MPQLHLGAPHGAGGAVGLGGPRASMVPAPTVTGGQRGCCWALAPFPPKPVLLSEDDAADDNPESQEMLEEQLVRLLTREVMDLISK